MNYLKALIKILVLLGITFSSVLFFNSKYLKEREKYEFVASIIDKHKLLKETKSPRIILVGGSNITFGINSDSIEAKTHIKTINAAILAPLGLNFILCDLEKEIQKGDIIYLSPEYDIPLYGDSYSQYLAESFYKPCSNCVQSEKSLIESTPNYLLFNTRIFYEFFWSIFPSKTNISKATIEDTQNVYFRNAFSQNGDLRSHWNNVGRALEINIIQMKFNEISQRVKVINNFVKNIETKGAKIYLIHPTVARSIYEKNKSDLLKFDNLQNRQLTANYISKIDDFVYPDSLYFDSFYHLNKAGQNIRTKKIIEFMEINSDVSNQN